MNVEEIPDGLHSLQLAAKVCEDTLGLPATKGNLELVGACIEAVAKKMFKGRPDASKLGMFVLVRRIEEAQKQGQKITGHWLRDGGYWEVEKPQALHGPPRYEHYGQGYGEQDITYLWKRYKEKRDSLNRPLTDGEIELLLDDLDVKRGAKPAWRVTGNSGKSYA
jgi:hypothetical protein